MALPANTATTYTLIGQREDLSDDIFRVAQTQTPFFSACEKITTSAVNHEWQTQALAAVDTTNAQLEGDDISTDAITPTVRLGNIHQISRKSPRVSNTGQAVDEAGRANELAYQETLKGLELKRDVEGILIGTNQAKVTGGAGTARKTASVLSWIGTNDVFGATGASPTTLDGAATRTDGTQRAFTETLLKSALVLIWEQGAGTSLTCYVGGFNKQAFSTFTGRATQNEDAKSKRIVNSVDFYEGDFHDVKVVANPHMRTRDCLLLNDEHWKIGFLPGRRMDRIPLAVTGDSVRSAMVMEYVLESCNEKSSGGVFDLTTS